MRRHHPGVPVTTKMLTGATECVLYRPLGIGCYGFTPLLTTSEEVATRPRRRRARGRGHGAPLRGDLLRGGAGPGAMSERPARTLRAQPHRLPARGRRAHRALQLAVGPEERRRLPPPHRGHRQGALHRRQHPEHPRRAGVAGPALGRGAVLPERGRGPPRRGGPPPARGGQGLPVLRHARGAGGAAEGGHRRGAALAARPGRAATSRAAESDRRAAAGEPFAIRFKVPEDEGATRFEDTVYGPQERKHQDIEDFALLRPDGSPLYNHVVVCDDVHMRVTDVIRGQDHLSNTHKQILLYEALGRTPPELHAPAAHQRARPDQALQAPPRRGRLRHDLPRPRVPARGLPELPGPARLVGRRRPRDLLHRGADPGLHPGGHRALERDPHLLRDGPPPVDRPQGPLHQPAVPLAHAPGRAPAQGGGGAEKAGIWDEAFAEGGARREWFARTVDLIRPRFITLLDFAEAGRAYFDDRFDMDPEAVDKNLRKEPRLAEWLPELAGRFERLDAFDPASAEAALRAYADERGVKAGVLINAARTAVTGRSVGPSLFDILGCLGRERVARRLRDAAPRGQRRTVSGRSSRRVITAPSGSSTSSPLLAATAPPPPTTRPMMAPFRAPHHLAQHGPEQRAQARLLGGVALVEVFLDGDHARADVHAGLARDGQVVEGDVQPSGLGRPLRRLGGLDDPAHPAAHGDHHAAAGSARAPLPWPRSGPPCGPSWTTAAAPGAPGCRSRLSRRPSPAAASSSRHRRVLDVRAQVRDVAAQAVHVLARGTGAVGVALVAPHLDLDVDDLLADLLGAVLELLILRVAGAQRLQRVVQADQVVLQTLQVRGRGASGCRRRRGWRPASGPGRTRRERASSCRPPHDESHGAGCPPWGPKPAAAGHITADAARDVPLQLVYSPKHARRGRDRGRVGQFLLGLVMAVGGAYLLTQQVMVTTGFWGWFGSNTFGLSLLPLIVGIGMLFFDGKSVPGLGPHRVRGGHHLPGHPREPARVLRAHQPLQHPGHALLLAGGLGLVARSLRPQRR